MEKRISVSNNTKMNLYVGSNIVPPGETRDFPESQVPHHLRPQEESPAKEPAAPADPLAELLKGTVKEVVAVLKGMPLADIEKLGELEQAGQARKGVLSAIADIQLTHAAQAEMMARVAAFGDEELAAALEAAATDINVDPIYLAALEAEAAKRNPGATE
jgi:hypothetical protein